MSIFVGLMFLCIGLFVGSFLNVVILRWNSDKSFIVGRSLCAHTGNTLPWYDLIPVVSFVVLRGKSRFSGKALSLQYPIVEIITGVIFAGVYWKFLAHVERIHPLLLLTTLLYILILCILLVIAFYDMRTKIIPNELVYSFIALSGLLLVVQGWSVVDVMAGPILWAPFAALWFFSRGTWMGYGDAKLAWGMGWMLGLVDGISAVVLSFWIGALISLVLVGVHKALTRYLTFLPETLTIKSEIPFAPFLVIGTMLVFFFEYNVLLFF